MSSPSKKADVKIKVYQDPILLPRKVIGEALVSQVSSKTAFLGLLLPKRTKKIQSFCFTTQTMIKIIDNGLSTVVFRELCDFLDISDKALAEIIKLPISTLAKRKKRGYFSSTESERIYRILNLYKQALDTFDGNEEYARKWLKEDAYGLGGVTPLEFAKTELGAKEVEQLLIRIDEGVFA